jgi:DNA-binding LacI/PurR family transcriptional regulator
MTKAETIAGVLEGRIKRGDYILANLHSDRKVAEDFGVSRVTARKALQRLEQKRLIVRTENGRLELAGSEAAGETGALTVAFLAPSFPSAFAQNLRVLAERAALASGCRFRPIDYLHWADPLVLETFQRFDGVVFCHVGEPMPELLRQRISAKGTSALSIGRDFTASGVPSLLVNPPSGVQRLLDHVATAGHQAVDCLWTRSNSPSGSLRVEQWQAWRHAHRAGGELLEVPVADYANPMQAAYDAVRAQGVATLRASALFCTDELAAIGACRALHELGRYPGRDVSVCTFGGDGLCRFMTPSITSLEYPDLGPYLARFIACLQDAQRAWVGPLLMSPTDELFVGESTAAVVPA